MHILGVSLFSSDKTTGKQQLNSKEFFFQIMVTGHQHNITESEKVDYIFIIFTISLLFCCLNLKKG